MATNRPELYDILSQWASSKYAVLEVDVSSTHDDTDLADIATHYPSGDAFSWDEFQAIIFITDLKHDVDYELKYNDTANDAELVTAKGTKIYRTGVDGEKITKIFFTNTATATSVLLKLEGY